MEGVNQVDEKLPMSHQLNEERIELTTAQKDEMVHATDRSVIG